MKTSLTRSDGVSRTAGTRRAGGTLLAVVLALAVAVFGFPGVSEASAHICSTGRYRSCVDVKGTRLHVDTITSEVIPYSTMCLRGHSQVMINGRHFADSNGGRDLGYCQDWDPVHVTTGRWQVKRTYSAGTRICSKFWRYTGTGPVNGYEEIGNACAVVR